MKKRNYISILAFVSALILSACGGNNGGNKGGNDDAFDITTDLEEVFDIHTDYQNKIIQYRDDDESKSYYDVRSNTLQGIGITASSEGTNNDKSFPNPYKLDFTFNGAEDEDFKGYDITYADNEEFKNSYTTSFGKSTTTFNLYNVFLGTNYFKIKAKYEDKEVVSDVHTFEIKNAGPRNLKIANLTNCRDIGGRITLSGGRIKQGLLFRTADPTDHHGSDEQVTIYEALENDFKMKTEIYVKDKGGADGTKKGNNDSITYYNCDMDYNSSEFGGPLSNLARNAERLRKVFHILSDEENFPVFYHCRIGTDRTGITAFLTNGVLGMSFEDCMQDYLFSNIANIGKITTPGKSPDSNGDDIKKYIDELLAMPGANWQEQCYNAVRMIGVPEAELQSYMNIMLEDPKPNNAQGQIFKTADKLTLEGGATLSTASDFKNPDNYAVVTNGKGVSLTADTEAKKYAVMVYLGSTDNSNSKDIKDAFTLTVDGSAQQINSKTYRYCGFGKTAQASRTGYMFNKLAEVTLAKGSHTIKLVGAKSDSFNIGTIGLIPVVA